mgnify:CR=1 FL=1
MKCCLSDLRYKEVIDQSTGQRLGYVCDAEIDLDDGKIVSLIVPGQKKLGGLLSGDDDYILPWGSISRLGEDIILAEVSGQQPRRRREKRQNHLWHWPVFSGIIPEHYAREWMCDHVVSAWSGTEEAPGGSN